MIRPYLDPGSGSFLIQLLIAGAAGATLFLVTSWKKIRKFFTKKKPGLEEQKEEDGDEDE